LGAETDLNAGGIRWLRPLPLWSGILAGPMAWAIDLTASYALVKWVCATRDYAVLHAITIGALAIVAVGAAISWLALQESRAAVPTDGGEPRQRAHFMAVLGLTVSALFALQIVAGAIPRWILDACH
jgi:hypothetical protein